MAIPLFAYSDVDTVEMQLMADEIKDMNYKKGDVIAKKGQMVTPALYILRTGSVVSNAACSSRFHDSRCTRR